MEDTGVAEIARASAQRLAKAHPGLEKKVEAALHGAGRQARQFSDVGDVAAIAAAVIAAAQFAWTLYQDLKSKPAEPDRAAIERRVRTEIRSRRLPLGEEEVEIVVDETLRLGR